MTGHPGRRLFVPKAVPDVRLTGGTQTTFVSTHDAVVLWRTAARLMRWAVGHNHAVDSSSVQARWLRLAASPGTGRCAELVRLAPRVQGVGCSSVADPGLRNRPGAASAVLRSAGSLLGLPASMWHRYSHYDAGAALPLASTHRSGLGLSASRWRCRWTRWPARRVGAARCHHAERAHQ